MSLKNHPAIKRIKEALIKDIKGVLAPKDTYEVLLDRPIDNLNLVVKVFHVISNPSTSDAVQNEAFDTYSYVFQAFDILKKYWVYKRNFPLTEEEKRYISESFQKIYDEFDLKLYEVMHSLGFDGTEVADL